MLRGLRRYLDPRTFIKFYMDQVTVKNPIKTKMLTSFLVGGAGDYACQRIEFRFVPRMPDNDDEEENEGKGA